MRESDHRLKQWKEKLIHYSSAHAIYGFTGTLANIEIDCLEQAFEIEIVKYPRLRALQSYQNVQVMRALDAMKESWLMTLVNAINEKCSYVPVLVLSSLQYSKDLLKALKEDSTYCVKTQSLIGCDPISINNALDAFNVRDPAYGYPVMIIDETICRGLDVKSSKAIEDNGGIYVIIAKVPSSTKVMEQALGRT